MRRFLWFFSIMSLIPLACSTLGNGGGGVDVQETTDTEPASNVLFEDDFSSSSTNWGTGEDAEASLNLENGAFRIFVKVPKNLFWTTPGKSFSDVRLEVDAEKTAGPDAAEYGVMCRYSEEADGSHNFYYLVIAGDTYAAIIKVVKDEQIEVSARDVKFEEIHGGNASNHITAECNGNQLVLSANGAELFSLTDDSLTSGDVGLIETTYEEGGIDVKFDNFMATKP